MKQYLSVLALLVRSSIYKIYILFAAIAVLHTILFSVWDSRPAVRFLLFAAEVGTLLWILCRNWMDGSSHQNYTIQRLSVTEKALFWMQASYNLICLLMFWAVHLIIAYVLYSRTYTGPQSLFLEFAGSGYLHSLIPGADWVSWVKNFTILGFAAVYSAYYSIYYQLFEVNNWTLISMANLLALGFSTGPDGLGMKVILIIMTVTIPFRMRSYIKRKEAETP